MKHFNMLLGIAVLTTIACSNVWAQNPDASMEDPGAEDASHEEVDSISVEFKRLSALRMHTGGNLLACDRDANVIRVIDPAGKLVASIELDFGPEAIDVADDGTIYCGGGGQLVKMSADGKVLRTAEIPDPPRTPEQQPRRYASEPHRVSGIAAGKKALFVAFGEGGHRSSKSKLFRFDLQLNHPKQISEDLRGCCQRCDVATRDGIFYLAENTAYRVVRFDAGGEMLGTWGEQSRTELEGFGSCCNPMNLCFGPDGDRVYVMDYTNGRIRVLQKKQ